MSLSKLATAALLSIAVAGCQTPETEDLEFVRRTSFTKKQVETPVSFRISWGTKYHRTFEQGIQDLRYLAKTKRLEEAYIFFPEKDLWVDVGTHSRIKEGKSEIFVDERVVDIVLKEIYPNTKKPLFYFFHDHTTYSMNNTLSECQDTYSLEFNNEKIKFTSNYPLNKIEWHKRKKPINPPEQAISDLEEFARHEATCLSEIDTTFAYECRHEVPLVGVVSEFGYSTVEYPKDLKLTPTEVEQDAVKNIKLGFLKPEFRLDMQSKLLQERASFYKTHYFED